MSEKLMRAGIKREPGWLYYLDKDLNVRRAKMARGGPKKGPKPLPELVLKTDLKREKGCLYYVDKAGDIARVTPGRAVASRREKAKTKNTHPKTIKMKKPAAKAPKKSIPKKDAPSKKLGKTATKKAA